jgi:hypothetical protein
MVDGIYNSANETQASGKKIKYAHAYLAYYKTMNTRNTHKAEKAQQ